MSTKRVKWILLIGSILGILICVFGCVIVGIRNYDYIKEYNEKFPSLQLPIRTLSIQIDEDQREELFALMRKFSEKHHLEFYLSFYDNKSTFYMAIEGEVLVIRALSMPITTTELDFDFFEKDPTNPPSQETVDEVYNDLKAFISEIPNVTITEEK
jgi:hypothetical protein